MHGQLQQLMNTQTKLLDSIRHLSTKLVEVAETAMEVGRQINLLSTLVDHPPTSEVRPVVSHKLAILDPDPLGIGLDVQGAWANYAPTDAVSPDKAESSHVAYSAQTADSFVAESSSSGVRKKNECTAAQWLAAGGLDTYFETLKPSHGLCGLDVGSRNRIRDAFAKQFGASDIVGARWGARIPAVARSIGFVVDS